MSSRLFIFQTLLEGTEGKRVTNKEAKYWIPTCKKGGNQRSKWNQERFMKIDKSLSDFYVASVIAIWVNGNKTLAQLVYNDKKAIALETDSDCFEEQLWRNCCCGHAEELNQAYPNSSIKRCVCSTRFFPSSQQTLMADINAAIAASEYCHATTILHAPAAVR
ncbi:uncharacterized protein LOC143862113 [Tasmannia lanceolata]|uniref:uncharacterized protein LOC143862113 n=1 Tax=Tasmannia lanceolata TaxID=3420 RepID=UPI00406387D5